MPLQMASLEAMPVDGRNDGAQQDAERI